MGISLLVDGVWESSVSAMKWTEMEFSSHEISETPTPSEIDFSCYFLREQRRLRSRAIIYKLIIGASSIQTYGPKAEVNWRAKFSYYISPLKESGKGLRKKGSTMISYFKKERQKQ